MISIIIPAFNEGEQIEKTISGLRQNAVASHLTEIIVADGGSTDNTLEQATKAGAKPVSSAKKGRAAQMNYAASLATGSVLYFLHADTVPPPGFTGAILQALRAGVGSGCFTLAFDYRHWFLKTNGWFTRFNFTCLRFGDQSLFVTKEVFERSGGFRENYLLLEDQEIIDRLKKLAPFRVIQQPVTTSARTYRRNGIYKTQGIFF